MHATRGLRLVLGAIAVVLLTAPTLRAGADAGRYFTIEVVDAQTGRGVPMVELRMTNSIRYWTDSAGRVAFHEPGLMGREVFFGVSSHGYTYPADGFGSRGKRLRTTPGGKARIKVTRTNPAERIYRITGGGIYRDSVLLGLRVPTKKPVLNGRVMGQDSTQAAVYRGKVYWFWGDTQRESYPLGNFATAGATSELPPKGLSPDVGVDLTYFVDAKGFARKMAPMTAKGMIWIDALMTLPDKTGRQRLLCHYSRMKSLGERTEHGMMVFNDTTATFEKVAEFPARARLAPAGQALGVTVKGVRYIYFTPAGYPLVRVRADWDSVMTPKAYEAFTPLKPGSAFGTQAPEVHRGADGKTVWSWQADTAAVDPAGQERLVKAGKIRRDEAPLTLRDVETGKAVRPHRGSVRWNAHRRRWIMICCQSGGSSSYLGEIWYAEADAPEGPWGKARKIVTHDRYSFYNPVHHAFFDAKGGRIIYFEGTYTRTFSSAPQATPRYDYNQIMYRLDLDDPRLAGVQGRAVTGGD